jgi:uncharacterized protein YrrD
MHFTENAEVQTSDGKKVGRIDRVVIDPDSKEVTHLILKQGLLFTRDKVVPIGEIDNTAEDRIVLKTERKDPDEFPDFEETHFVPVSDDGTSTYRDGRPASKVAWYYPVPNAAWWRLEMGSYPGFQKPPYVRRTDRNIPEGTVPVEEGARVLSKDGEHVGDVKRIFTDEEEQRVTHLLICKGKISKSWKLIPSMWMTTVGEKQIRLSIDAVFVDNLPEHSPQSQ